MLMTARKLFMRLPALMLAALMPAAQMTAPAAAQQAVSPVVAVIDIQAVLRDSAASRAIRSQIEKQWESYKQEITRQENELRAAEKELARQETLLAPEALRERRRSFEQRSGELQRNVQNRKRQLDGAFRKAMNTVQKSLGEVIEEVAKENGIKLVFLRSNLVFAVPDFDITKEIVERLNARLPSVSVQIPDK